MCLYSILCLFNSQARLETPKMMEVKFYLSYTNKEENVPWF